MSSKCIVCQAGQWRTLFKKLRQCQTCGFVQTKTNFSQAALLPLYDQAYFQGKEYSNYLSDAKIHRHNFRHYFAEVLAVTSHPREVFEIGCAYGLWLELLTQNGIPCSGIDVSPVPVRYAAEQLHQNAFRGDFLRLTIEPGRFDVFCLWDTIEHLAHPELYLKRIFDLLPPGGTLFFTTGDIESRYARWRGLHWRMIHPPTHLHYFSQKTIRRLLTRLDFCDIIIHPVPTYRNLQGVINTTIILRSGYSRAIASAVKKALPQFLQEHCAMRLNLGDIMLISAKKPT